MVANDYRRFNYSPYAYRTTNYGKTWTRIVDEDDVQSYTLSIVEDPKEPNLLFLGTDDGLYISIDAGNKWQKWTNGFPTVSVKDLVIHPRENDLVIGTFGRAAWVLDDIRPLREMAGNNSVLNQNIKVFQAPTAYHAAYQQPTGSRFGADALFNGENRESGARFSYYFKSGTEEAKAENDDDDDETEEDEIDISEEKMDGKHKDSLYLRIYDGNRLIRTLKQKKPDSTGIYKWRWRMNEAGVERPSRSIRNRKNEPSGTSVKPGTYRAELSFNDETSSTTIEIKSDPRLQISEKAINESYAASKKLEELTETAAEAVHQLVESKNTAKDFRKKLKEKDKEQYKEEIKLSKEITKKIDSVIAIYLGEESDKQGIIRSTKPDVMQRIGQASWYSGSRPDGMTATEQRLMQQAKNALNDALKATNDFFVTEWEKYKSKMETIELSPFKKTKTFETK